MSSSKLKDAPKLTDQSRSEVETSSSLLRSRNNLHSLPTEILDTICSLLPPLVAMRLASTCKSLRQYIDMNLESIIFRQMDRKHPSLMPKTESEENVKYRQCANYISTISSMLGPRIALPLSYWTFFNDIKEKEDPLKGLEGRMMFLPTRTIYMCSPSKAEMDLANAIMQEEDVYESYEDYCQVEQRRIKVRFQERQQVLFDIVTALKEKEGDKGKLLALGMIRKHWGRGLALCGSHFYRQTNCASLTLPPSYSASTIQSQKDNKMKLWLQKACQSLKRIFCINGSSL